MTMILWIDIKFCIIALNFTAISLTKSLCPEILFYPCHAICLKRIRLRKHFRSSCIACPCPALDCSWTALHRPTRCEWSSSPLRTLGYLQTILRKHLHWRIWACHFHTFCRPRKSPRRHFGLTMCICLCLASFLCTSTLHSCFHF